VKEEERWGERKAEGGNKKKWGGREETGIGEELEGKDKWIDKSKRNPGGRIGKIMGKGKKWEGTKWGENGKCGNESARLGGGS